MILTEQDYAEAAKSLKCEINAIKAVCQVEAPKGGFTAEGLPVILYEPYLFSDLTKHKYDSNTVTIKGITYPLSINRRLKPWTVKNAQYGPTSIQHIKLEAAKALDNDAALKACSWGKFQILGSNYAVCGYKNVNEFVTAMYKSEGKQLAAFVAFVKGHKLDKALQEKDWFEFAYHYNGPRQDKGTADTSDDYSTYIAKAYIKLNKVA